MKKPSEWNEGDIFNWTMGTIIFIMSLWCIAIGITGNVDPRFWFFAAFFLGSFLLAAKVDAKWIVPTAIAWLLSPMAIRIIYLLTQ